MSVETEKLRRSLKIAKLSYGIPRNSVIQSNPRSKKKISTRLQQKPTKPTMEHLLPASVTQQQHTYTCIKCQRPVTLAGYGSVTCGYCKGHIVSKKRCTKFVQVRAI